MQKRLHRRFFPWIFFHFFEFIHYYIGALFSLYMLHYYSSEIPVLAKGLGDIAMEGRLDAINLWDFAKLAAFILIFRTLSRLLFFYPARIQQKYLRVELVERLETAPPRNYKDYNEGQIFQTLYNDLNRLRGFMGFALLQFGNIIIASFVFIPKINAFNSDFLWAFLPLVLSVSFFSILIFFFQPLMKRSMDEYAETQNFLLESYEAKKTIQNYHAEKNFYNKFNKLSEIEMGTFFKSSLGRAFSFPLIRVGVGASLIWAALIVKNQGLSASDLIFFSSFLFLVLEPIMFLSWIGIVSSQGFAAWSRVKTLIKKLDKKLDDEWITGTNNIHLSKLPFWESQVTLDIPKGEWVILVGDTGCGKSFLIEKYSELLGSRKQNYSFIHQEPYLYNDTLAGNIFLGNEKDKEGIKLVKHYLKMFALDSLGDNLDELLNMELGENGKRVSGGQAKRIALIRSLVSDVNYVLWDDPFSSVDLILEDQIIKTLKQEPRLKNRTFLMSSHRLSTVRNADHIIYLDKEHGIIESGVTQELLNKESKVHEFFKKQLI